MRPVAARVRVRLPRRVPAGASVAVLRFGLNDLHYERSPGEFGRAKKSGADQDGISTQGAAHHVIVDHCSLSWATDENLSVGGPRFEGATPEDWRRNTSHAITYSHNLIYEGLGESVHEKGEHSKGTLVHDNATGVLLLGNLYAANRERNALFKGGVHAAMVNNLIYNPGGKAVHYNLVAHEWAGHEMVTGQVALVGWFALVLGIAFGVQYGLRRAKAGRRQP